MLIFLFPAGRMFVEGGPTPIMGTKFEAGFDLDLGMQMLVLDTTTSVSLYEFVDGLDLEADAPIAVANPHMLIVANNTGGFITPRAFSKRSAAADERHVLWWQLQEFLPNCRLTSLNTLYAYVGFKDRNDNVQQKGFSATADITLQSLAIKDTPALIAVTTPQGSEKRALTIQVCSPLHSLSAIWKMIHRTLFCLVATGKPKKMHPLAHSLIYRNMLR